MHDGPDRQDQGRRNKEGPNQRRFHLNFFSNAAIKKDASLLIKQKKPKTFPVMVRVTVPSSRRNVARTPQPRCFGLMAWVTMA
jgi:hypothetical protein